MDNEEIVSQDYRKGWNNGYRQGAIEIINLITRSSMRMGKKDPGFKDGYLNVSIPPEVVDELLADLSKEEAEGAVEIVRGKNLEAVKKNRKASPVVS